jgi:hypothetical protein
MQDAPARENPSLRLKNGSSQDDFNRVLNRDLRNGLAD